MPVHAGVDAQADGAPDRLGHLPLVRRAQARLCSFLYSAVRRHELGDYGEILQVRVSDHDTKIVFPFPSSPPSPVCATHPIHVQRPQSEDVDEVLLAGLVAAPLAHLGGAQVVGGVDVADVPAAGHLARVVVVPVVVPDLVVEALDALPAAPQLLVHDVGDLRGVLPGQGRGRGVDVEELGCGGGQVSLDWSRSC